MIGYGTHTQPPGRWSDDGSLTLCLVESLCNGCDREEIEALIAAGGLNDKLARQVFEGVLAGEGSPDEVIAARGLALVSDDTALTAAVDEAVAAMPEVADKVRAGNLKAIGPLVGAVMKATRGQADAARVRELILERLT